MILLCGIPSETPLAMVADALRQMGLSYVFFNQRHFEDIELTFDFFAGQVHGSLMIEGQMYSLDQFTGVYLRLMDEQLLPELAQGGEKARLRAQHLHRGLLHWCDLTSCRVINRTAAMASNFSKPYQAQLIRQHGFSIPETLITNQPDAVHEFAGQNRQVIYKSMSGVRSIVQMLDDGALTRLESIRWCPIQFQAFVPGTNVRVHTIGERVFATRINSEATDYRYAQRQIGQSASLETIELSPDIARQCARLAHELGLAFAGIDLKITPNGEVFCFEVNPCPAFSYYESHTGQPIAQAVAAYLAGPDY